MMSFKHLCLLVIVSSPLLQAQGNKVDEVRRAKSDEADARVVEESISTLAQQLSSAPQLAAIILGDPSAHARRDASEKILREVERKHLEEAVREELASFARTRSDHPGSWVDQVMIRQQERINKTVDDVLNGGFGERFAKARDTAVGVQRETLNTRLTPTTGDVERMAGPYRAFVDLPLDVAQKQSLESGAALINKYATGAHSGQVLFEENQAYLNDRTTEIFSHEITDLWEQLQYVMKYSGGDEVEASRIESAIRKGLLALPDQHRPFPITQAVIHDRAAELEQNLFMDYVKSQLSSPCSAFPTEVVLNGLPAEPRDLPKTLDEHVAAVASKARPRISSSLLDKWTSGVSNPARKMLRRQLEEELRGETGNQILTAGLENCARDGLRPFREMMAAREISAKWPSVADLSEAFNDADIAQLYQVPTIEQAVQLSLLTGKELQMEESEKVFQDNRQRLLQEGMNAVQTQVSTVRNLKEKYQSLRAQAPDGSSLQAQYEDEALRQWSEQRNGVLVQVNGHLANPNKYEALFDVTREEIKNILKKDSVQPPQAPADGQRGPGGGGGGGGGGTGDGIGPGSGGGGGGGGGGACSSQSGQQVEVPQASPQEVPKVGADWLMWLGLVVVVGTLAYLWGRRQGSRRSVALTAQPPA